MSHTYQEDKASDINISRAFLNSNSLLLRPQEPWIRTPSSRSPGSLSLTLPIACPLSLKKLFMRVCGFQIPSLIVRPYFGSCQSHNGGFVFRRQIYNFYCTWEVIFVKKKSKTFFRSFHLGKKISVRQIKRPSIWQFWFLGQMWSFSADLADFWHTPKNVLNTSVSLPSFGSENSVSWKKYLFIGQHRKQQSRHKSRTQCFGGGKSLDFDGTTIRYFF